MKVFSEGNNDPQTQVYVLAKHCIVEIEVAGTFTLADGRIAYEEHVALSRPRDHHHPDLVGKRNRLLTELGVYSKGAVN